MLAVLVGYYNLHLVAVLKDVRVVELIFLINIKLTLNLIRLTVSLILEVVAAVAVLGEHDVLDTMFYRCHIMLTEVSLQLLDLNLRRFARLVELFIVEVLVIAGAVLCIIDDIVGYCHIVLAELMLVVTSD